MSALGPIAAMLAGGGAGGAAPPPGVPAQIQLGGGPSGSMGGSDRDWEQDLQDALSALRKSAADAPDHIEAAVIDKCVAAIQGLLAKRQQGAESALGTTPAHKAMSRAY